MARSGLSHPVSESWQCSTCLKLMYEKDPTLCDCGESFCGQCLLKCKVTEWVPSQWSSVYWNALYHVIHIIGKIACMDYVRNCHPISSVKFCCSKVLTTDELIVLSLSKQSQSGFNLVGVGRWVGKEYVPLTLQLPPPQLLIVVNLWQSVILGWLHENQLQRA